MTHRPWLTPGRVLLIVLTIGLAIRAIAVIDGPLVLFNDSYWYLLWAHDLAEGKLPAIPPFRTPGYSALLAAPVAMVGESPTAIHVLQHGLALAAVLASTLAFLRLTRADQGSRFGLVLSLMLGLGLALDPYLLGFSSIALTEAPTASALLLALALGAAFTPRRYLAIVLWAGAVGLCAGSLVQFRPAMQVSIPFLALALATAAYRAHASFPRAVAAFVSFAAAFLIPTGPWILHNHARGVPGMGRGVEILAFFSLSHANLLKPDYPLSPKLREGYDALLAGPVNEDTRWRFMSSINAVTSAEACEELWAWAKASALANPGAYARRAGVIALWQLNIHPKRFPPTDSETAWLLWALTDLNTTRTVVGGTNMRLDPALSRIEELRPYAQNREGKILRPYYQLLVATTYESGQRSPAFGSRLMGIPQAVLFGCLFLAGLVSLLRRRLDLAFWAAAVGAYYAVHVVLLAPYDRYGVPVWIAAWFGPALLAAALARAIHPASSTRATADGASA